VLIRDIQIGDLVAFGAVIDPLDSLTVSWWLITEKRPGNYPGLWWWWGTSLENNKIEEVLHWITLLPKDDPNNTVPPCYFVFRDGILL
jgi:hypothetical protein